MDVPFALPERRYKYRYGIQPVVQVFTETAGAYGMHEVHVGGGYDPDICLLGLGRSHPYELAGLQHPEQPDLCGERKLSYLIEKDGSLVGNFKITLPGLIRPCERTLLMAEKFGLYGTFRNRTAVDRYIVVVLARAECMNYFGNHLLSHTAFTCDENGQIGTGYLYCGIYGIVQLRIIADNSEAVFYFIKFHVCKVMIFCHEK